MKNILWIDDEPWTIRFMLDHLDPSIYNTIIVPSLSAALRAFEEQAKAVPPVFDLIIIDVINRVFAPGEDCHPDLDPTMNTDMAGITFARILRSKYKISAPIMFYTVVNEPEKKAIATGSITKSKYIVKAQDAIGEIKRLLGDR